jgi:hypothetical protein
MAVIWLQKQPGELRGEPSLICPDKTGGTGDNVLLAGACHDSKHRMRRGGRGSGIFNLTIIWFADVSLQKTAKTARATDAGAGQAVA